MAAHLEAVPDVRAVVNFAPVLLDQIEEYAKQVSNYLHERTALTDPLLAVLVTPKLSDKPENGCNCLRTACVQTETGKSIAILPLKNWQK